MKMAVRHRHSDMKSAKSMPMPNALRILVVGAGVGGISIARGLLRDGHDVTVFEQRPDMRPGGGAVTIWSNGSTVLEQLGVDMDGAVSCCPPCDRDILWSPTGQHRPDRDRRPAGRTRSDGPTSSPADRLLEGFPADRIRCNSRAAAASVHAMGCGSSSKTAARPKAIC